MGRSKRTVYSVQILRGVAACLVVAYHASANLRSGVGFTFVPELTSGSGGVDLFFAISGFVMVHSLAMPGRPSETWTNFLKKRLLRIVPLYWILTSVKVAAMIAKPALFRGSGFLAWNVMASYLFIPSWDAQHNVSPVISAGWTLCYEMFFYVAFAICVAMRRRPAVAITPVFIVLAAVGVWRSDSWGPVATLFDPLLLEFVAGMWIAELVNRAGTTQLWRLSPLLAALAFAAILVSGLATGAGLSCNRVILWGVPSALLLATCVTMEEPVGFGRWRLALLLGDASYSVYLTHVLVLPVLLGRFRMLGGTVVGEWIAFVMLVLISIGLGVVVYFAIERPITRQIGSFAEGVRLRSRQAV